MPRDGTEFETLGLSEGGCVYVSDTEELCGAAAQRGSSYCPRHHALCHVPSGSRAERSRIAEMELAGEFVGGRVARGNPRVPPQRFMRALDQRQRGK